MRNARQIVDTLLEWGKIDNGKDDLGRTRWSVAPERTAYKAYWVAPSGEVIPVPAHKSWAIHNVLGGDEDHVYMKMKQLGYLRATVDKKVFYVNPQGMNAKQEASIDKFLADNGLTIEHVTIA